MKIWFTADMRFGDTGVIASRDRPFASADEMTDAIVTRWNELVRPNDTVWILGGAVTREERLWQSELSYLADLNGRKYLLAGPDDHCLAGFYENWAFNAGRYADDGELEAVITGAEYLKRRGNNKPVPIQIPLMGGAGHGYPNVVLSAFHTPYDSLTPDEFADYRPRWKERRDGQAPYFLHGHAPWVTRDLPGYDAGREINVGMDAWDFEPVPADLVASLLVDR